MSYNDKQQSGKYLLNWVNQQRLVIGECFKIYSFDQLKQSKLLSNLLTKINEQFFQDIINQQFQFKLYLLKIQKYLNQLEDLRIKRIYKQRLLQNQYVSQIVTLVLFIIMRNSIKDEFVGRILQLDEDTQNYLMTQLQKIEQYIQNNMQIKQIFDKVEELQYQNEMLMEKIKQIEVNNKKIQEAILSTHEQNIKINNENRFNNLQKHKMFEQLGIHQQKDYLSVYKDLQLQNVKCHENYKNIEHITANLQQKNNQINQKLQEDNLIIEYLNQEINKYKQLYSSMKEEINVVYTKQNKQNPIKEFRSATNLNNMKCSFDCDPTNTSFKNLTLADQQSFSTQLVKDYNQQLTVKLQASYQRLGLLNLQMNRLKEDNKKISKMNRQKQRKVQMVRKQLQQFYLNYQFTISG